VAAFSRYYADAAWTWEIMALTKARVIGGDAALGARIGDEIAAIISRPQEKSKTAADVDEMRERLRGAKPAVSPWDLKNAVGGFVEIDFTVQYLILTNPSAMKSATGHDNGAAIKALAAAGVISAPHAGALTRASRTYEAVQQVGRAATGGVFAPGAAGDALSRLMIALVGAGDLDEAESNLAAMQSAVRRVYEEIVVADRDSG
jgi:glutamate-ammonia-ligase adenylyltransferase